MEHVHQVSSWLERSIISNDNDNNNDEKKSNENNQNSTDESDKPRRGSDKESFIIKGGCPFKSFHKSHSSTNSNIGSTNNGDKGSRRNSSQKLARAMEDFSLAAIMGRMASQSFEDDDALLLGDDEDEKHDVGGDGNVDAVVSRQEHKTSHENKKEEGMQQQQPKKQLKTVMRPSKKKSDRRPSLLSEALKTGTAESHTAAENVHFVNNFIQGKIDRELYTEMVTGLYHIYVSLEKLLEEHAPKYFGTLHFPKELARTQALEEDMEYWHGHNWHSKPECTTPSPAVQDYIDRMTQVGKHDPLLLLSHAYTRYLGDLSGGKVLSRIARRALNLGRGYECGLQFYNFDSIKSAKVFKDKYRTALDELTLRPEEIGKLVAEANVAFALNMRVFEELDVKGGVEGARVRNVEEALAYYDIEGGGERAWVEKEKEDEEEAKCPFGFVGGVNPHDFGKKKTNATKVASKKDESQQQQQTAPSTTNLPPLSSEIAMKKEHTGGRCPWPFVFFHDPIMGMKDWQTWFVIGMILCWIWSCLQ